MLVNYIANKSPNFQEIENILYPSIQSNNWSNNGQIKQELEIYLHDFLELNDTKRVICLSSATSGLHLLMMYYEYIYNRKLKWLSTSYTFPSVIVNNTNDVTLCDIDKETYNIPFTKENLNYDGFIITNLFGTYPKDIEKWINYCKGNNKILIFDNASSPLSKISKGLNNSTNICNLGDSSIISFHPTKYLGSQCEAGAIVIDKDKYDIINSLTNFGFNNSRKYNKFSSNFKLDEVRAAFLLNHLKNYDIGKHKTIQRRFAFEILNNIKNIKIFNYKDNGEVLGNLCLEFNKPIDNRDFIDLGIQCHKYYLPLDEKHKNSMELYSKIINFPLNSNLTDFQIEFIIKQIKSKIK